MSHKELVLTDIINASSGEAIISPRSNRNSQRKVDWQRYMASKPRRTILQLPQADLVYRNPIRQTCQSTQGIPAFRFCLYPLTANLL